MFGTAYESAVKEAVLLKQLHGNVNKWWNAPHNSQQCAVCLTITGTPTIRPRWYWSAEKWRLKRHASPKV